MKKIEEFLDRKIANKYSISNYSLFKVLAEVYSSHESLGDLYTKEIKRVDKFREDLKSSLSDNIVEQPKIAENWSLFLKPRTYVLDFWSTFNGALSGLIGLSVSLYTAFAFALNEDRPWGLIISLLLFALLFLTLKSGIDKKNFWYKYVSSHLDAIAKTGSNN